jgi:hypothetical protein
MSVCDLGRPPRDAAVQNLTVNDTVRVNKLLKATKAEIDRLCAVSDNSATTFVGSFIFSGTTVEPNTILDPDYALNVLPTGVTDNGSVNTSPAALNLTLYTDVDLVVRKLQAAVTTGSSVPSTNNVDVSVSAGTTPTSLSAVLTLNLLSTNGAIVRETDISETAIIPAGSYYSVVISEGTGSTQNVVTSLVASWTLVLDPNL